MVLSEKDAPNKTLCRKQHQAEYQLHDITLKELASAKKEKQDLLKQQKTLGIIESNYETMLRDAGINVPDRQPGGLIREEVIS